MKKFRKRILWAVKKLQLPIYLLAVNKNVSTAKNISAAYWMVSFQGRYQIIPSEPLNYHDIKDDFKSILTKITSGILERIISS